MPADGGDADAQLAEFAAAGVDVKALAATLQADGAQAFVESWQDLLKRIVEQTGAVA
jgi:transaldolase